MVRIITFCLTKQLCLIAQITPVKVPSLLCGADSDQCTVFFIIARKTNRQSTSKAALNTRISCVLGSMNFHTKAQRAAISDVRKIKNIMSLNIYL